MNLDHRSRLVARPFNRNGEDALFAATPPLEGLKFLVSMVASQKGRSTRKTVTIL